MHSTKPQFQWPGVRLAGILSASIAALLIMAGCMAVPQATNRTAYGGAADTMAYEQHSLKPAPERPGLGTKWGETRTSRVYSSSFTRARSKPTATATIRYNKGNYSGWRNAQPFTIGNGLAKVGIRNKSGFGGGYLRGTRYGGEFNVYGKNGQRYSIEVENLTGARMEVVLSVDGLDVMDGRGASYRKRGYVLAPYGRLEVSGFRKSMGSVAAFRFSGVDDSYAAKKHGNTRNVGVIGVAIFHEKGSDPRTDSDLRRTANPWPGESGHSRFATPPS